MNQFHFDFRQWAKPKHGLMAHINPRDRKRHGTRNSLATQRHARRSERLDSADLYFVYLPGKKWMEGRERGLRGMINKEKVFLHMQASELEE